MPVQLLCPNPQCRKALSLADDPAGRPNRCPSCGSTLAITRETIASGPTLPRVESEPAASEPGLPAAIGHYAVRKKLGAGAFGIV
jgi:hypothetical protein